MQSISHTEPPCLYVYFVRSPVIIKTANTVTSSRRKALSKQAMNSYENDYEHHSDIHWYIIT